MRNAVVQRASEAPRRAGGRAPEPARHAIDWIAFACIFTLALALRLAFLRAARAVPLFNALIMDGQSYGDWSDRIAAGDWLGDTTFYQAPLYPYFLAVVKLVFGGDLHTIRVVQAVIGSLACSILFLAGKRFFSRPAGIVAGVLLAVYPPAIFFDALIQKTNLGVLFTVLLLLSFASAQARPTLARFLGAGAVLGLLMLTREETILLVPALSLWIVLALRPATRSERARWLAGWLVGLGLVLVPVGLRNLKVGGEFVLTTSQAGSNFYMGNNAKATGMYMPLRPGRSNTEYERKDAIELAERAVGKKLTPKEVSRYWFGQSWDFIRSHPVDWVALLWKKLRFLLNGYEFPDYEDQYFFESYVPALALASTVWNYGVLVPLAAAGVVLTFARRRDLSVLYVMMATMGAGVVLFYVFARYRYPLVPIFMLFASAFLVGALDLARAKRTGPLLAGIATLLLALPFANWPIYSKEFQLPQSHNNAGIALARLGKYADAVEQFQQAIALGPSPSSAFGNLGLADMYGNLGLALSKLDRNAEAIEAYETVLAITPNDSRGEARLGATLAKTGDLAAGVKHLARAVEIAPANTEARAELTRVLVRSKRYGDALRSAEKHVELAPSDSDAALTLAWLLATTPEDSARAPERAIALAEPIARQATRARAWEVLAAAYASAGRHDDAVRSLDRAFELAPSDPDAERARDAQLRELYRRGEAYRLPR